MTLTFDPVWEKKYEQDSSYRNKYPWSEIVSFVFSNFPDLKNRKNKKVLELGCGTGSNLIFCSKEGMNSFGIDASQTAIDYAIKFAKQEGVNCKFIVGDFTSLPYKKCYFDLIFDRSALSLCSINGFKEALNESYRVLKPGGLFYLSPFSDQDSSFHKIPNKDGVINKVTRGLIHGLGGQILFLSYKDLRLIINENNWKIISINHIVNTNFYNKNRIQQATWNIILKKNNVTK